MARTSDTLTQSHAWAWRPLGHSVCGATHQRRGQSSQDAIAWWPESPARSVALAVADGHGSQRSFRSGDGASIAVAVALDVLRQSVLGPDPIPPEDVFYREILKEAIVERWREGVLENIGRRALAEPFPLMSTGEKLLAYGTTLVAVAAMPSTIVYIQLGDGDIVTVNDDGVASRPLPADRRLLANETTSLCSSAATDDFRYLVQPVEQSGPALIMLATDGYCNSFASDSDFLRAAVDILQLLRTEGHTAVTAGMDDWLTDTSRHGSGDDISLGLLYRIPPGLGRHE